MNSGVFRGRVRVFPVLVLTGEILEIIDDPKKALEGRVGEQVVKVARALVAMESTADNAVTSETCRWTDTRCFQYP
jgi:hypothetical protein